MAKVFIVVFLIFGTVVGSGFSSGKEIMVFFSRFGALSYLYIFIASIMFFVLFYFFLLQGKKILKVFEKYKFLNTIIAFICLVFCSSMFAGIKNLFSYFPTWIYFLAISLLLICTLFVTFHGINGLEKVNFVLMPFTTILFLFVLIFSLTQSANIPIESANSYAGFLYSPLYVALNTCMSGIVICKTGDSLSKKQSLAASFIAASLIFVFLTLGNFVLQKYGNFIISEMPFLTIAAQNKIVFAITFLVILVGCFTTLISQCYTLRSSLQQLWIKDNKIATSIAVFLPFAVSSLGFSCIVSFLYPICSVLGVLVLILMIISQAQRNLN